MFEALTCAITPAEAGIQATVAIWYQLSPSEQDRWLEQAETSWPGHDVFLKVILPASERIIEDEQTQDAGGER